MSALDENAKVFEAAASKLGVELTHIVEDDLVDFSPAGALSRLECLVAYYTGSQKTAAVTRWPRRMEELREAQRVVGEAVFDLLMLRKIDIEEYRKIVLCAFVFETPVSIDAAVGLWSHERRIPLDQAQEEIENLRGSLLVGDGILRLSGAYDAFGMMNRMIVLPEREGIIAMQRYDMAALREGRASLN